MFYDLFLELCREKNVKPTTACKEMGLSNSLNTKWKKTGATPQGETLYKIAAYFDVSVDYLLQKDKEKAPSEGRRLTDEDIKFALFKGNGPITDEMYEEVRRFAAYVEERERKKTDK